MTSIVILTTHHIGRIDTMFAANDTPQPLIQDVNYINVARTNNNITNLYRGFEEIPEMMFQLPTIILGLFARSIPDCITMEHIELHKTTNTANNNYLVAMTEDIEIAKEKGHGNAIIIDTLLLQNDLIDVHQTYKQNQLNFSARLEKEVEHVCLVILYCSIKAIILNDQVILNPFHLTMNENNSALAKFSALYNRYISLVRQQYQQGINPAIEDETVSFINSFLDFYANYSEINPFAMSLDQLQKKYPEFMEQFIASNPYLANGFTNLKLFNNEQTLKDLILKDAGKMFEHHHYTHDRAAIERSRKTVVPPSYEDPYNRFYE